MTRENIFDDVKREDWMTSELEEKLSSLVKDSRINCAQAQQFARDNNISMNKMKSFLDALKLKVSNCQLGCF